MWFSELLRDFSTLWSLCACGGRGLGQGVGKETSISTNFYQFTSWRTNTGHKNRRQLWDPTQVGFRRLLLKNDLNEAKASFWRQSRFNIDINNIMKLILVAVLLCRVVRVRPEDPEIAVRAPSTYQNLDCQCDSYTWTSKGRILGNCVR